MSDEPVDLEIMRLKQKIRFLEKELTQWKEPTQPRRLERAIVHTFPDRVALLLGEAEGAQPLVEVNMSKQEAMRLGQRIIREAKKVLKK